MIHRYIPPSARFDLQIMPEPNSGCWLWTGALVEGYGVLSVNGRLTFAHRFSYEQAKGPIPAGLEIDHLCRVRCCANPDHLEPVTTRVNLLRGVGAAAINARKTHCIRGHAFKPQSPSYEQRAWRRCHECHAERERLRRTGQLLNQGKDNHHGQETARGC